MIGTSFVELICAPSLTQRRKIMTTPTFRESILNQVASISLIVVAALMGVAQIAMMFQ
jgi:hypothetical protein